MPIVVARRIIIQDEDAPKIRQVQVKNGIFGWRYASGAYPALAYCEEGERPVKLPPPSDKLKVKIEMRKFRARSEAYSRLRLR